MPNISIHAPPRGATSPSPTFSIAEIFQFTPLREGRLCARHFLPARHPISIHAPPRGATSGSAHSGFIGCYFNSRPSARGDSAIRSAHHPSTHFNSRPSARGDERAEIARNTADKFQFTPLREGRRNCVQVRAVRHKISIHAPPRGATAPNAFRRRSRRKFQFTPLREGRPNVNGTMVTPSDFNSRPSARGDAVVVGLCAGRHISIHAPPRGATRRCRKASASSIISIHAPPRGATILTTEGNPVALNISIHAPPRGATPAKRRNGPRPQISIHAPPRGATSIQARYSYQRQDFNSRPSARGDCRRAPPTRRSQLFQFTPLREGRRGAEGCRCKSC